MPLITLDAIAGSSVELDDYFNECRTLQMLSTGLQGIAGWLKQREEAWQRQNPGVKVEILGLDVDGTKERLDQIACMFHWFGVSLCNFARLVGFVQGLSKNEFTRADLGEEANFQRIKDSVDGYVEGVPELAEVLVWRHKVGAHFAITAPKRRDNVATLDMSVMFPVSFSHGRYRVGAFVLSRADAAGTHRSAIPCWSVTEIFENLKPRYWSSLGAKSNAE